MTPQQQELARNLFKIGAIKFGAFKLARHEKEPNAPLSPVYIDLRVVRSSPPTRYQVVLEYERIIDLLAFDVLADVPTAATPFVAILAHRLEIPMVTPRELKTHGSGTSIDGTYEPGEVALLIDDLITGADSKMRAIRILEAEHLVVRDGWCWLIANKEEQRFCARQDTLCMPPSPSLNSLCSIVRMVQSPKNGTPKPWRTSTSDKEFLQRNSTPLAFWYIVLGVGGFIFACTERVKRVECVYNQALLFRLF